MTAEANFRKLTEKISVRSALLIIWQICSAYWPAIEWMFFQYFRAFHLIVLSPIALFHQSLSTRNKETITLVKMCPLMPFFKSAEAICIKQTNRYKACEQTCMVVVLCKQARPMHARICLAHHMHYRPICLLILYLPDQDAISSPAIYVWPLIAWEGVQPACKDIKIRKFPKAMEQHTNVDQCSRKPVVAAANLGHAPSFLARLIQLPLGMVHAASYSSASIDTWTVLIGCSSRSSISLSLSIVENSRNVLL